MDQFNFPEKRNTNFINLCIRNCLNTIVNSSVCLLLGFIETVSIPMLKIISPFQKKQIDEFTIWLWVGFNVFVLLMLAGSIAPSYIWPAKAKNDEWQGLVKNEKKQEKT